DAAALVALDHGQIVAPRFLAEITEEIVGPHVVGVGAWALHAHSVAGRYGSSARSVRGRTVIVMGSFGCRKPAASPSICTGAADWVSMVILAPCARTAPVGVRRSRRATPARSRPSVDLAGKNRTSSTPSSMRAAGDGPIRAAYC